MINPFRRKRKPFCADLEAHLRRNYLDARQRSQHPQVLESDRPTDSEIKAWIARNPEWFGNWVARQRRIMGTRVYGR